MSVGGLLAAPIGAIGLAAGVGESNPPPDLSMNTQGMETLNALENLAPLQYEAQRMYQPLYAGISASSVGQTVLGGAKSPGLLGIYGQTQPQLNTITNQGISSQRDAAVSDLQSLAPGVVSAYQSANPNQTNLLNNMMGTANANLSAGTSLTPAQMNLVQQDVRQGQAARGMGYGMADQYGEALGVSQYGQQLLQQRQGAAAQAVNSYAGTTPNPISSILGMPYQSSAPEAAAIMSMGGNFANNGNPYLFNPYTPYAANLYDTNYNANAASNISNANSQAAILGGMMGAFGKGGGGGISSLSGMGGGGGGGGGGAMSTFGAGGMAY